jgi:hypothetical protein
MVASAVGGPSTKQVGVVDSGNSQNRGGFVEKVWGAVKQIFSWLASGSQWLVNTLIITPARYCIVNPILGGVERIRRAFGGFEKAQTAPDQSSSGGESTMHHRKNDQAGSLIGKRQLDSDQIQLVNQILEGMQEPDYTKEGLIFAAQQILKQKKEGSERLQKKSDSWCVSVISEVLERFEPIPEEGPPPGELALDPLADANEQPPLHPEELSPLPASALSVAEDVAPTEPPVSFDQCESQIVGYITNHKLNPCKTFLGEKQIFLQRLLISREVDQVLDILQKGSDNLAAELEKRGLPGSWAVELQQSSKCISSLLENNSNQLASCKLALQEKLLDHYGCKIDVADTLKHKKEIASVYDACKKHLVFSLTTDEKRVQFVKSHLENKLNESDASGPSVSPLSDTEIQEIVASVQGLLEMERRAYRAFPSAPEVPGWFFGYEETPENGLSYIRPGNWGLIVSWTVFQIAWVLQQERGIQEEWSELKPQVTDVIQDFLSPLHYHLRDHFQELKLDDEKRPRYIGLAAKEVISLLEDAKKKKQTIEKHIVPTWMNASLKIHLHRLDPLVCESG